jgi:hypothetical protein
MSFKVAVVLIDTVRDLSISQGSLSSVGWIQRRGLQAFDLPSFHLPTRNRGGAKRQNRTRQDTLKNSHMVLNPPAPSDLSWSCNTHSLTHHSLSPNSPQAYRDFVF